MDTVIHDEPEEFVRTGGLITSCPGCHGKRPEDQSIAERERLDGIAEIAMLMGDDIDGLVSTLDDMESLGF
jgi:hypothetical protein